MTTHQLALLRIQMQTAVSAEAIGYVADLSSKSATPAIIADRLAMLDRHCPALVAEYREAMAGRRFIPARYID